MALKLGRDLTPSDQQRALEKWRQRTPQFATPHDWLNGTLFRVKGNGRLDRRARNCYPAPTMQMLMPARMAAE